MSPDAHVLPVPHGIPIAARGKSGRDAGDEPDLRAVARRAPPLQSTVTLSRLRLSTVYAEHGCCLLRTRRAALHYVPIFQTPTFITQDTAPRCLARFALLTQRAMTDQPENEADREGQ